MPVKGPVSCRNEFGFHFCNVAPPGIELQTLRCATANGLGPIGTAFWLGGFQYWQIDSIMMIICTSLMFIPQDAMLRKL